MSTAPAEPMTCEECIARTHAARFNRYSTTQLFELIAAQARRCTKHTDWYRSAVLILVWASEIRRRIAVEDQKRLAYSITEEAVGGDG